MTFLSRGTAGLLGLVVALMLFGSADSSRMLSQTPHRPIVVRVRDASDLNLVSARAQALGLTESSAWTQLPALRLNVPSDHDVESVLAELSAMPEVLYAEPVRRLTLADSPSDPLYASRQSTYLTAVQAPNAWDIERGQPDVIVAVVDTGLDLGHPDLQGNIWFNPGEIANNGVDDDGNGCTDDLNGCSFVTDSSPGCENATNGFVRDDIGHGTFVAGVIAAAGNGSGMVGVARGVKVMPIKVLDCYGSGDSDAAAQGIIYAARNGASVINVSLGGLEDAAAVTEAVRIAHQENGAIVIAAAGNDGSETVAFPARLPDVVAVGAASAANPNKRASFSNTGPEIDVVAVGEKIVGTLPENRCFELLPCIPGGPYAVGDGTSFSTPQVSGLAALMVSQKRDLTPAQITELIKSTATKVPGGDRPDWAGTGRINMLAALKAVQALASGGLEPCMVASVIDGDTFDCTSGRRVRMLQIDAPELGQCGGDWAKAAAEHIFLTPGRTVYLQYDATIQDELGRALAAPIWRGWDGADYNLSIVMAYVGLARAADTGAGNLVLRDWALASQTWAAAAQWNMWAPGKTFNGGC